MRENERLLAVPVRALLSAGLLQVTHFRAVGEIAFGVTFRGTNGRGISGSARKVRKVAIEQRTRRLHFLGGGSLSQKCERATVSFVMSVRPSIWNNSAPTGRIFMKFDISVFLKNLPRKPKFHSNLTGIIGTLHEAQCTFLIISRSVLLRMRNVSDRNCRENQNTHFVFNSFSFCQKSCFYQIMWKNILEPGRPHAHAHCMLDTEGYKHALRICNTYCFSTATVVARTLVKLRHTYAVCLLLIEL